MKIIHFDFFNSKKIIQEPLRSKLKEKMVIIYDMITNKDYDGDKCAEILFSE